MTFCKILDPGEQREAAMRTMCCKHRPLVVQPMNCAQVHNRAANVFPTGEGKSTIYFLSEKKYSMRKVQIQTKKQPHVLSVVHEPAPSELFSKYKLASCPQNIYSNLHGNNTEKHWEETHAIIRLWSITPVSILVSSEHPSTLSINIYTQRDIQIYINGTVQHMLFCSLIFFSPQYIVDICTINTCYITIFYVLNCTSCENIPRE